MPHGLASRKQGVKYIWSQAKRTLYAWANINIPNGFNKYLADQRNLYVNSMIDLFVIWKLNHGIYLGLRN
jgi:hypothetical protein